MDVNNTVKIEWELSEWFSLLEGYTLDEIQLLIKNNAFDLKTMDKLRPYFNLRIKGWKK